MKYKVSKEFRFEAGHVLTHHDGKCARQHGHNYRLIVTVSSTTLISSGPKKNMVIDFSDMKKYHVGPVLELLDHYQLNDVLPTDSPTAEYLASTIWSMLDDSFSLGDLTLEVVRVYETDDSFAEISKEHVCNSSQGATRL